MISLAKETLWSNGKRILSAVLAVLWVLQTLVVPVYADDSANIISEPEEVTAIYEEDDKKKDDRFSVYAVVYKTTFAYGDYQYSLSNNGKTMFSEVLDKLHITSNETGEELTVKDVKDIQFSNETLLSISKITEETTLANIKEEQGLSVLEGDTEEILSGPEWILLSRRAFSGQETLTVTANDDSIYEITMTDADEHSWEISDAGETYRVTLTYDDSAELPGDAELRVREITEEDEGYTHYFEEAIDVTEAEGKSQSARFFDIEILADGEIIEPSGNVQVEIALVETAEEAEASKQLVHFAEEGVEVIESQTEEPQKETAGEEEEPGRITFDADSFSVYGVVYTVDFHWEVDGQVYQFSLPGGGFVSLTDLVEVLGIAEKNGITADEFVSKIANTEFSNESLIRIVRITEDVSALELKEQLGVEPYYSAILAETQIAEKLAKKFAAPDWVLVSLKAFDTEEILTITMKNGDVITVRVTDAQERTYDKVAISTDSNAWMFEDYSGTYVFYSTESRTALSSNAKSVNDMTGFSGTSVSPSGDQLKSAEGNSIEWTLSRDAYGMGYTISTVRDGKTMYLRNTSVNSSGNVGNVGLTENISEASTYYFNVASNGQAVFVTTATNGTQKELQWSYNEKMFYTFNTSWDHGSNSRFTLYRKGEQSTGSYYILFSGTHQNASNNGSVSDSYHGAEDRQVTVTADETGKAKVVLPMDTTPPTNYADPYGAKPGWKINGWYDVTHNQYYDSSMLGKEVEVDSDTVFYADWVPVSYNYGQDQNALNGTLQMGTGVGEIANLSGMVTTEVYDFSSMFNINDASKKSVYEDGSTWKVGDNDYAYIFFDDNSNQKGFFDNPENRNGRNLWTGNSDRSKEHDPYTGIYDGDHSSIWGKGAGTVAGTVFNPVSNLIGSHYLGIGDGLFYLNDHGYYEYDSAAHAASYNQSEGKFYVYQQTQATVDKDGKSNTAFLPLNGEKPAYSKYGGEINYWFGIKTTINFKIDETRTDSNGNPLIFEFSGDDDVWVVVDGKLYLDLGGIHSASSGTINFTDGTVTVNGSTVKSGIQDFTTGDHVLEFYYLERGASDSNCKITFNLPLERPEQHFGSFGFDKLDQFAAPVEGATFALFRSAECIQELEWDEDEPTDDNNDGIIEENEHHIIHHKAEVDAEKTLGADGFNVHFNHIPVGTYYLEEIHIPDGYNGTTNQYIAKVVVGENESFIYLRDDDQQQKVTKIINEKLSYGSVSFNKKNIHNQPVNGAQFTLYKDRQCTQIADAEQGTAVSGEDGKVTFGGEEKKVQAGNYYMKETSAPGEYVQSGQVYFVHIAEDGTSDTSFIAPADDEKPEDVESYADLTAYYRWKQTDSVINERVRASIKKVDENGKNLLGAEFTLTKVEKPEPHNPVTGAEAYSKTMPEGSDRTDLFIFEDLGDGYYKVEETKTPEGYTGLSDPLFFEVKDGEIKPEPFPQGVFFAAEGIAVMNRPVVLEDGSVQVRKHWLDENDRAVEGTEKVKVTLHREKMDAPAGHTVKVIVEGSKDVSEDGTGKQHLVEYVWVEKSKAVNDGGSLTVNWHLGYQYSNFYLTKNGADIKSMISDGDIATLNLTNIKEDIVIIARNHHQEHESDFSKKVIDYGIHFNGGTEGEQGTGEYKGDDDFETSQKKIDEDFEATQELSSPDYSYTWENLPVKDDKGNPYRYYITEDPLSNYSTEILNNEVTVGSDGKLHGTVNVYNKKTPKEETGELTVEKKWFKGNTEVTDDSITNDYQIRFGLFRQAINVTDGTGIPASITDTKQASDEETDWEKIGEYTVGPNSSGKKGNLTYDKWKVTIGNLLKSRTYDGEKGGTYYIYKVQELQVLENRVGNTPDDYSPEYVIDQDGTSVTIKNKVPTTSITVKKIWSDKKNEKISFVLYKIGSKGENDENPTVETTEYSNINAGGDGYTIEPLDVRGPDGVTYTYVVSELAPAGYTPTYDTSDDGKVWTITNTKNAGTDKTTKAQVEKIWKTADGQTRSTTDDDNIQFKLTPWKLSTDYIPVVVELIDAGKTSGKETTYYVESGKNLSLAFANEGFGHYVTVSGAGAKDGIYSGRQKNLTGASTSLTVSGITEPRHISVVISDKYYNTLGIVVKLHDVWARPASENTWTCFVSSDGETYTGEIALVNSVASQTFTELPDKANIYTLKNGELSPKTDADSVDGWKATIGNLPWIQYDATTGKINIYRYVLSEISVNGKQVIDGKTDDFTVSVSELAGTEVDGRIEYSGTITNTESKKLALKILKVDAENKGKTLKNAEFSLIKIDEKKTVIDTIGKSTEKTTGEDGILEFNNVAQGYYRITEIKTPDGYVITGDNAFYVHVTETEIELLMPKSGTVPAAWEKIAKKQQGNVLSISNIADSKATITVGNTPGASLPATGGPGTRLFTILGSILLLGAGALLWRRRRLV